MPEPEASRKRRKFPWYARCVVYVVVIYLVYCALLFFFQHKLIFPASAAGEASPAPFHRDTQVLEVETDEGTTVGWFIPAPAPAPGSGSGSGTPGEPDDSPRPLVVILHGNAELIDHQMGLVAFYHAQGVSVLLPEYRGYGGAQGGSDGAPSQATIVPDVVALYDLAVAMPGVDASKVVIHGRSIGGAIGAQLADQRPCAAVVVESTGTSVAGQAWRYGVPPFLVRSPFHTERVFRELDVPILILHGEYDRVFAYHHAESLCDCSREATLVKFNAGHGLPTNTEVGLYEDAICAHLEKAGVVGVEE